MSHISRLESMYLKAKVQRLYPGISIELMTSQAKITLPIHENYFHAGDAVHGSVYFRLLDDAAYFAASTIVEDFFLLTSSFQIDLLRPVQSGMLIATGKLIHHSRSIYIAESVLVDDKNRKVALGKGTFMKSTTPFEKISSYEK